MFNLATYRFSALGITEIWLCFMRKIACNFLNVDQIYPKFNKISVPNFSQIEQQIVCIYLYLWSCPPHHTYLPTFPPFLSPCSLAAIVWTLVIDHANIYEEKMEDHTAGSAHLLNNHKHVIAVMCRDKFQPHMMKAW